MIKIERKSTEKAQLAIASLQKAREMKGTYNTPEVNAALMESVIFARIEILLLTISNICVPTEKIRN